jgi:hypothetical protein
MSDTIQSGMDCANCSDVETNACRRCDGVGRKRDTILSAGLEDGKPCGHPGCLNHVSHPCEGCGRIGGRKMERTERADEASNQSERYAACVEAIKVYLQEHSCSNSQGTCQDETNLRKALADLEAPK